MIVKFRLLVAVFVISQLGGIAPPCQLASGQTTKPITARLLGTKIDVIVPYGWWATGDDDRELNGCRLVLEGTGISSAVAYFWGEPKIDYGPNTTVYSLINSRKARFGAHLRNVRTSKLEAGEIGGCRAVHFVLTGDDDKGRTFTFIVIGVETKNYFVFTMAGSLSAEIASLRSQIDRMATSAVETD